MLGLYIGTPGRGCRDEGPSTHGEGYTGTSLEAAATRWNGYEGNGVWGYNLGERDNKAGVLAANRLICDTQYNMYIVMYYIHSARFGHALPLAHHAYDKPMV